MNSASAKLKGLTQTVPSATVEADAAEPTLGISDPLAWPTLADMLVD